MKTLLIILFIFIMLPVNIYPCNSCGGGTGDLAVLALDGRALINLGFFYDHFNGNWDNKGTWTSYNDDRSQKKVTLSAAYRLSRHLQFGVSVPFVFNSSNVPGLKTNGSGLGDIVVSGRYEFFHEYQLKKKNGKSYIDKTLPYLALTFGVTLPTGRSDEKAESDVDITGKGYYSTSLGISLTKSLVRSKLQLITDLSWQHGFSKTYDSYYGEPITNPYKKSPGDRINYALTFNYIFSSYHSLALSASGFSQTEYKVDDNPGISSAERSLGFSAAYTYYPITEFRITPSVKYNFPSDNLGMNAVGSTTFNINFTYYFPDFNIK